MENDMHDKPLQPNSSIPPIICFTSGKGGCGKTTLAINFANIVARSGKRVLIVDCDISNRGSTGIFHSYMEGAPRSLSFADLLGKRVLSAERSLIQLKNELYFIPSFDPHDPENSLPISDSLEELGQRLREAIYSIAQRYNISCIVLDLFCGIDNITTASAIAADKVIIVNEPDIVTFTGSINLLNHLNESFTPLIRKPDIHLVINRVRSTNTVRQLSMLYKDNLEKAVSGTILCYFPFNRRIFQNFGKYPYISDVLPKSLFVKKMQLLAYAIFKGNHDHLLEPKVREWNARTLKHIYIKLFDPASMDEEQVIVRISQIPVLAAFWFLGSILILRGFTLTSGPACGALILSLSGVSVLYLYWLWSFWPLVIFNFKVAIFRYRMERLLYKANTLFSLGSAARKGVLPALASSAFLLIFIGLLFSGIALFFGYKTLFEKGIFHKKRIEMLADNPFIRSLSLRNQTIDSVNFQPAAVRRFNKEKRHFWEIYEPSILIDGTTFKSCSLQTPYSWEGGCFKNLSISGTIFDRCVFARTYDVDSLLFDSCQFNGVKIKHFFHPKSVTFRKCVLANCTLQVDRYAFIRIDSSTFDKTVFTGSRKNDFLFLCFEGKTLSNGLVIDTQKVQYNKLSDTVFVAVLEIAAMILAQEEKLDDKYSQHTVHDTISYWANSCELQILLSVFSKCYYLPKTYADSLRRMISTKMGGQDIKLYRGYYYLLTALIELMKEGIYSVEVDASLKNLVAWHDANSGSSNIFLWYLWEKYSEHLDNTKNILVSLTREYMQGYRPTIKYMRDIKNIYDRKPIEHPPELFTKYRIDNK
jgi:MinD-like ATPase involved in chromosome partitioning or flagellar assembly